MGKHQDPAKQRTNAGRLDWVGGSRNGRRARGRRLGTLVEPTILPPAMSDN
jgi:hypothetical protein